MRGNRQPSLNLGTRHGVQLTEPSSSGAAVPPPAETDHLLTEAGDELTTEAGDNIDWE
jgi:hypothetical protein